LPGEIDIIPTQIWFQHWSEQTFKWKESGAEIIDLGPSVRKTLKLGNIKWRFHGYFTL